MARRLGDSVIWEWEGRGSSDSPMTPATDDVLTWTIDGFPVWAPPSGGGGGGSGIAFTLAAALQHLGGV